MKANELIQKVPELRQLKKRLEQSDADAKAKNAAAASAGKPDVSPLHFKVYAVEVDDVFRNTAYEKLPGGEGLVQQLEDVLESYPDAAVLKVALYKSKGSGSALEELTIRVQENKNPVLGNVSSGPDQPAVQPATGSGPALQILQLQHTIALNEVKSRYEREIDRAARELDKKDQIINEKDREIEELKKKVLDGQNALSGVQAQKSDFVENAVLIGKEVFVQGTVSLLKKNPKILEAIGMSKDKIAALWENSTDKPQQNPSAANGRPKASAADDGPQLTSDHQKALDALIVLLKNCSFDEIKYIYTTIGELQKENGDFDLDLMPKVLELIRLTKEAKT